VNSPQPRKLTHDRLFFFLLLREYAQGIPREVYPSSLEYDQGLLPSMKTFRTCAAWSEDIWGKALPMLLCIMLTGCRSRGPSIKPFIEFTRVPLAGEGGPDRVAPIEGRVVGFRPQQRIVLYAHWGIWWVQPLADRPFTEIQSDSTWRNSTHFGTDYAALLVEPGYHPATRMDGLPGKGDGVVAVAVVKGRPVFWQTWWFRLCSLLAFALAVLALFRLRMLRLTTQLNVRFEERLSERTRIARELHDTLLQGFHGLLLRFQTVSNQLPEGPAKQRLDSAIDQAAQTITESRDAVQQLRSSTVVTNDLALP